MVKREIAGRLISRAGYLPVLARVVEPGPARHAACTTLFDCTGKATYDGG